jgi:acetamidase/formamidase
MDRPTNEAIMAASNHTHRIAATPATVHWGFLDAALACVLEIESGDRLCIETVSGGKARLPADHERFGVLPDHLAILEACSPDLGPHILTGPVHIRGAEPGNVLRVFIEAIKLRQNWGWNEIAGGCGLLPEHEALAETLTIPIDLQAGVRSRSSASSQ